MDEMSGDIGGATPAPDASPAPESSSASTPAGATTLHAPEASDSATGPIPLDRHKAILESTRRKAQDEIEARYAHLKDIDPDEIAGYRQFQQLAAMDPKAAHAWLGRQLGLDQSSPTDGKPQPDLRTEDGRLVYSAEQAEKLMEWREAQLEKKFSSRLDPLQQRFQQGELQQRAQSEAAQQLAEARTWDYFTDHEKEIAAAMKADKRLSLEGAYRKVVVPKLRQLERDSVVNGLNAKASASTVSPSSSGHAAPQTLKDIAKREGWGGAFRHAYNKAAGK